MFYLCFLNFCELFQLKLCVEQAVGLIAGVGDGVLDANLKPGSAVATVAYGGFSEYKEVLFNDP